ncbi:MAG TPA: hypothetical protein PKC21_02585 [Oligoflexia bacterium]|nr:hypothetical protein [Oligoflexia bacterium]HMR24218.1 hypothetical protein [Oligoflexia bacterium]
MYRGKHFIFILLFSCVAFAQDSSFSTTVIDLLHQHRYVLIKANQTYDFHFDFHTGKDIETPSEYKITFSMGSKTFKHEHGHHLSIFVNDFTYYVDKYDTGILLEDGVIYFLDENGEKERYIDDNPEEYNYLYKYMPIFSDMDFYINCPNHLKADILNFIEGLNISFNQQTIYESNLRKYSDFFIDLGVFLDILEAQDCYGVYSNTYISNNGKDH